VLLPIKHQWLTIGQISIIKKPDPSEKQRKKREKTLGYSTSTTKHANPEYPI
jgi:hypothetical protein